MLKYDIYKIDNIFIKLGYVLVVFFGIMELSFILSIDAGTAVEDVLSRLAVPSFLLLGSIVLLTVGYAFRFKENRINSILSTFRNNHEIFVPDLIRNTGFTRKQIEGSLFIINRRRFGYYQWDPASDMITDVRLKRKMVFVDSCTHCGNTIGKSFPVHLDTVPVCQYCGNPLDIKVWNELKFRVIDEIRNDRALEIEKDAAPGVKPFSLGIFILLLVFFWPGPLSTRRCGIKILPLMNISAISLGKHKKESIKKE